MFDEIIGNVAHSLRNVEEGWDSDRDGSLADEFGHVVEDIPVVGKFLGGVTEEMGDFFTDAMGTRHRGVFSDEGTFDRGAVTDADYESGSFQGNGTLLNQALGGFQADPAALMGAFLMPPGLQIHGALGMSAIADEIRSAKTATKSSEQPNSLADALG